VEILAIGIDRLDLLADAIGDGNRVRAALLLDVQADDRRAVDFREVPDVLEAVHDVGDVADADGPALLDGDDRRANLVETLIFAEGADVEIVDPLLHVAARKLDVLAGERLGHVAGAQVGGAQPIAQ
jgi:hypothetical protein